MTYFYLFSSLFLFTKQGCNSLARKLRMNQIPRAIITHAVVFSEGKRLPVRLIAVVLQRSQPKCCANSKSDRERNLSEQALFLTGFHLLVTALPEKHPLAIFVSSTTQVQKHPQLCPEYAGKRGEALIRTADRQFMLFSPGALAVGMPQPVVMIVEIRFKLSPSNRAKRTGEPNGQLGEIRLSVD